MVGTALNAVRSGAGGPEPGWRADRRRAGRDWLARHPMPSPRDELWRDSPVEEILTAFSTHGGASRAATGAPALDVAHIDEVAGDHGGARLVLVDGIVDRSLSRWPTGDGVEVTALCEVDRPPEVATSLDELVRPDGTLALSWTEADDGVLVRVTPTPSLGRADPIHIVHLATPGHPGLRLSHPVAEVHLAPGATATVIESVVGAGPTMTNASTVIRVGADAHLHHHLVQTGCDQALHLCQVRIAVGRDAEVRSQVFTQGLGVVRTSIDVSLEGDGARADVRGLSLPGPGQSHNTVATVEHSASHTSSTQQVRAVIDDRGRGSFTGRIVVAPGTVATVADQTNRNLLLGPRAQADSQPWLEILADDVRCSHGATVGRLDDEALFYLRSRGIPGVEARDLLVDAFTRDLLDGVEPHSLRYYLRALLGGRRPLNEVQP